jgi:hypothetical protein
LLVGVALGVVTALACALILSPRSGGDVIAAGSAIALLNVPGGAAFLATSCLARAALHPRRRNRVWLAALLGLLPVVIPGASVVEVGLYLWLSRVSSAYMQTAGPMLQRFLLIVPNALAVLVGATLGALAGLGLARLGGDGRDAVSRSP